MTYDMKHENNPKKIKDRVSNYQRALACLGEKPYRPDAVILGGHEYQAETSLMGNNFNISVLSIDEYIYKSWAPPPSNVELLDKVELGSFLRTRIKDTDKGRLDPFDLISIDYCAWLNKHRKDALQAASGPVLMEGGVIIVTVQNEWRQKGTEEKREAYVYSELVELFGTKMVPVKPPTMYKPNFMSSVWRKLESHFLDNSQRPSLPKSSSSITNKAREGARYWLDNRHLLQRLVAHKYGVGYSTLKREISVLRALDQRKN